MQGCFQRCLTALGLSDSRNRGQRLRDAAPLAGRLAGVGKDVLVEPEEISRVVAALDRRQTGVGGRGVCLAHPVWTLHFQEVDVDAVPLAAEGPPERRGSRFMHRGILAGVEPEPDDRHEETPLAVGKGGGVAGNSCHGAAEPAELNQTERRRGPFHRRQR